jgi:hypothetical protein
MKKENIYLENKSYFERKIDNSFISCFVAKNLKQFFQQEMEYTTGLFMKKSLKDMVQLLSKKIEVGIVNFERELDGLNNQEFIECTQNLLSSCYHQSLEQLKIPFNDFQFIDNRIDSGRASQDLIDMLEFYRDNKTYNNMAQ